MAAAPLTTWLDEIPPPVAKLISKWVCRHTSQEVCPWNEKFARTLPAGSPFAPRAFIAGKDARTLAREVLTMTQDEFSAAFKGSPMKRAKLRGLQRNAAVVLGNAGNRSALPSLAADLSDEEPLVRATDRLDD